MRAQRMELLAPAGNLSALQAALGAGADAVYFGLGAFNARGQAANFVEADIPELMRRIRLAGAKAYLTLNTLLRDDELDAAAALALKAYKAGIDAVVVQDIGLALLLKRYIPELPLHGSTQMSLGNPDGLRLAHDLGLSRVILPRELSQSDMKLMVHAAQEWGLETEVFIHGALCVSVSGQCALSLARGGRSANRGSCAQPCRLSYQLSRDTQPLGQSAPLLSPKDQSLIDELDFLAEIGVDSLKIEGRRKAASYVRIVTEQYRQTLDEIYDQARGSAGIGQNKSDMHTGRPRSEQKTTDLLLAFNRGGTFTQSWFKDEDGRSLLSGSWSGNHGIFLGKVSAADAHSAVLSCRLEPSLPQTVMAAITKGSVIALRNPGNEREVASAPIGKFRVLEGGSSGGSLEIKAFHPDVLKKIYPGDLVFLMQLAEQSAASARHQPRRMLDLHLTKKHDGLWLCGKSSYRGQNWQAEVPFSEREGYPALAQEKLCAALAKLGGTAFRVGQITSDCQAAVKLADLNQARRELLTQLERQISQVENRELGWPEQAVSNLAGELLRDYYAQQPEAVVGQALEQVFPKRQIVRRKPIRKILQLLSLSLEEAKNCDWKELLRTCDELLLPIEAVLTDHALLSEESLQVRAILLTAIEQRKEEMPDFGLTLVLPPQERLSDWMYRQEHFSDLARFPFTGLCSSTLETKPLFLPERSLSFSLGQGGHVMNLLSLLFALRQGISSLEPAAELDAQGILDLDSGLRLLCKKHDLSRPAFRWEIQLEGRRRLMYMKHCPLGLRRAGCQACLGQKLALDLQPEDEAFVLLCHPAAGCYTELVSTYRIETPFERVLRELKRRGSELNLRYTIALQYDWNQA